jgi:hypothetical protein
MAGHVRWCSRPETEVVDAYCGYAERMERRGGAILQGKNNSSLMGFCGTCDNDRFR